MTVQIACHAAGAWETSRSSFTALRSTSRRWATRRTLWAGWPRAAMRSDVGASNGLPVPAAANRAGLGAAWLGPV